MSRYPEHERLEQVVAATQAAGEFLAWAQDEKGLQLASIEDDRPCVISTADLLAE